MGLVPRVARARGAAPGPSMGNALEGCQVEDGGSDSMPFGDGSYAPSGANGDGSPASRPEGLSAAARGLRRRHGTGAGGRDGGRVDGWEDEGHDEGPQFAVSEPVRGARVCYYKLQVALQRVPLPCGPFGAASRMSSSPPVCVARQASPTKVAAAQLTPAAATKIRAAFLRIDTDASGPLPLSAAIVRLPLPGSPEEADVMAEFTHPPAPRLLDRAGALSRTELLAALKEAPEVAELLDETGLSMGTGASAVREHVEFFFDAFGADDGAPLLSATAAATVTE